jgi:hypothetical protein
MPQDRLDRLIVHSQSMQIGRETAAEGMPPPPLLPVSRKNRFDIALCERVEIESLRFRAPSKMNPSREFPRWKRRAR